MIIRFTVENWMSFRNRVSFSMIAGSERQHKDRVPLVGGYKINILPVAAVYGGNASGKSNFFKALAFVRELVVEGTKTDALIPVDIFRLDPEKAEQPARFTLELLVDETIYEFSFAVTRAAVLEEKLVQISSASEKVLYERKGTKYSGDALKKDKRAEFVSEGTQDNQLFLTNAVSQKLEQFQPIYNWFKNTLQLIAPDSRFGPFGRFIDEEDPLNSAMNKALSRLDTGILHLGGEEIALEKSPFPADIRRKIQVDVKEGMSAQILAQGDSKPFFATRKEGNLIIKKLVTYHQKTGGTEVKFEMGQESDGSQRIVDLLPAFIDIPLDRSSQVYFIDELDRSLHTLLTRRLLEMYLAKCNNNSRAQLLFTTHDVLLMDQHLLRRDEMWVAERDEMGASDLLSFSEYKDVRYDKDIRKSYLQGRMGGIPRILLAGRDD